MPPPKNRQEGRLPEGRLPVQLEEWSESTKFCAVRLQPPRITQNSLNPHHDRRLGVNPENSRNVQRMTQILHLSHIARANNAKFATFAANTR